MNLIERRITELSLSLPSTPSPIASYVPAKQVGKLVFVSGQLPIVDGKIIQEGFLTQESEIDAAYNAAKICTLNGLAAIKGLINDLDKIKQIVRVVGYVASSPTFTKQPSVVNGASNLLVEIFGEKGIHARSAVGVTALPLNASVEIEIMVEVE